MNMRIKNNDNSTFTSGGLYNLTAQVQENTLLNRGLLDVGGYVIPQVIMSNNNDERIERSTIQGLYFVASFMAPFVLLPFFNKRFLAKNNIVKNFKNNERKIIEVSKKYLTKDANYLKQGIYETAELIEKETSKLGKKIEIKKDFENILARYEGKGEKLKNDLIKAHGSVLFADFLSTALMWCATPWIGMQVTKYRTKRSGFSATYGMINEEQSKKNAQKHEQEKKKKLAISAAIALVPSFVFPNLVTKGFKDKSGILSKIVKRIPEQFNYTKGIYISKFIFGAVWLLCDYPSAIVAGRDKYEKRDLAIRGIAGLITFFAGDFVLNNALGRLSDKYLKTEIMDKSKLKPNAGFFKKLALSPKNFAKIEDLNDITPKLLKRTKNVGASIYWLTLLANMAILGFGLPAALNKMLKKSVKADAIKEKQV